MNFDLEDKYDNQVFERITSRGETIDSKEFDGCTFKSCSFIETHFRECKFLNCNFEDCELNLIRVSQSSFMATTFLRSKVLAVNWVNAYWPKRGLLNSLHFSECVINHSTFMGLNLKKMQLTDCIAKDVDFTDADLTEANFSNTDFFQSRFNHTNLTGADFRGAKNYAIATHFNTVKHAHFDLPEAMSLLYGLDIHLDN
jgi:fluoroquinolone resistance protein